jgi:tetratricopeptide (TPR) repeat protein
MAETVPGLTDNARGEYLAANGVILLKEGKVKEALEVLEKARTYNEANPYITYNIAEAAAASGDEERAITELRKVLDGVSKEALKSDGGMKKLAASSWYNLGVLLAQKGSLAEAQTAFRNSLDVDPADKDTAFNHLLVSRLLEERRKQEEENKQKSDELKKKLEELAKRILALIELQGKTLASLWQGRPELLPKPAAETVQKDKNNSGGQGLMNMAKGFLEGLLSGTKKDAPPLKLDENLKPEEVAQWVAAVFAPQDKQPDETLAVTEVNIRDEARKISAELAKIADEISPKETASVPPPSAQPGQSPEQAQNPLAAALKQSAMHLDVGSAHADAAAGSLGETKGLEAGTSMTLAEREFLLALAPFIQPPQQQQSSQDKNQQQQDNSQQKSGEQKEQKEQQGQKEENKEQQAQEQQQQEKKEGEKKEAQQLTKEEAEKLLESLREGDKEALKELLERRVKTSGKVNVEKDW